jgi:transcriptional regulator with XRE-family HTH domain
MDRIGNNRALRWYLVEWRKKRGLTQEDVANRCETNKGQISKLERGELQMNDRWIADLAHAYDIEPFQLLQHPDRPTADDLLKNVTAEDIVTVRQAIAMLLRKAV